ncbi:MAG: M23 family metallopeptidase [Patescibacteria group bacterium]|nr:M23 family metallopeptidase [Patescibacteria group bacterium]
MKAWPVPDAYSRKIPSCPDAAFGSVRSYKKGAGKHAGIDIYAPVGSKVLAIESGRVVHVSEFTGAPWSPQWRRTWYVMIEHKDGRVSAYGELRKPRLRNGREIKLGQIVGYTAKVIFGPMDIDSSMLHFELHRKGSRLSQDWIGKRPERFIDPTRYLRSIG